MCIARATHCAVQVKNSLETKGFGGVSARPMNGFRFPHVVVSYSYSPNGLIIAPARRGPEMQRITITIDDELLGVVDRLCRQRGYASRSEAIREMLRQAEAGAQVRNSGGSHCFAALSYIYDHGTRDLAKRLTNSQHDHHDLSVATLHVHLSRHDCLEIAVLEGSVKNVQALADRMTSQRGVRHGHLRILPSPHTKNPNHRRKP
jgi:CopG family transcriptional regulator, nickel-responsive regulator